MITAPEPQLSPVPAGLFETSDFYLACFLSCRGYELACIRREGRRMVFGYRDRASRAADVMALYTNQATVTPLAFVAAIKALKALIHNG